MIRLGAGTVVVVADGGASLTSRGGMTHILDQYGVITIIAYSTDVFNISGDLV